MKESKPKVNIPSRPAMDENGERNPIDVIKYEIKNARILIDNEFMNSANTFWPNCVITRCQVILSNIELAERSGLLLSQEGEPMKVKIRTLIERCRELARTYKNRIHNNETIDIPEETKVELVKRLNVLN